MLLHAGRVPIVGSTIPDPGTVCGTTGAGVADPRGFPLARALLMGPAMVDIQRERRRPRRALRWLLGAAVVAVVGASTVAVAGTEPAAPEVERAGIWIADVERGEFVREVRSPGTLVPRKIRWITATTPGRVEKIAVEPGDAVDAATVVVELANSDLELAALEAESDRAAAGASLTHLRASLQTDILSQQASMATIDAELADARREHTVTESLQGFAAVARNEAEKAGEHFGELASRRGIEANRLTVLKKSRRAQLAAEKARVERLATVAAFRRHQVGAQRVTAGQAGVVQEVAVEPGQWVVPGDVLAKVADPTDLDAQLLVPQVQAKDLVRGLAVAVDTRAGVVEGRVRRVEPSVREGTVAVEVELLGELPAAARPDLSVEGAIELSRKADALFVKRPVHSQPGAAMAVFKLTADGNEAVLTSVEFGLGSAATIEVVAGAEPGDTLIVSDMARWADHDRIELK